LVDPLHGRETMSEASLLAPRNCNLGTALAPTAAPTRGRSPSARTNGNPTVAEAPLAAWRRPPHARRHGI
jgi:hypothetical protein